MTWYREVNPVQEPFDLGLDASGRARVVFNIMVVKRASTTFLEEIRKILVNAGVAVFGTDLFETSKSNIPEGDGPYLSITETGGTAPERTQNVIGAYPQPSAQIVARATNYEDALAMAWAAYNALVVVKNQHITP